jgi:hypothetical protein
VLEQQPVQEHCNRNRWLQRFRKGCCCHENLACSASHELFRHSRSLVHFRNRSLVQEQQPVQEHCNRNRWLQQFRKNRNRRGWSIDRASRL